MRIRSGCQVRSESKVHARRFGSIGRWHRVDHDLGWWKNAIGCPFRPPWASDRAGAADHRVGPQVATIFSHVPGLKGWYRRVDHDLGWVKTALGYPIRPPWASYGLHRFSLRTWQPDLLFSSILGLHPKRTAFPKYPVLQVELK